jgi:TonB family protein
VYPIARERTGRLVSVVRGLLSRRAFLYGLTSAALCLHAHAADEKDSSTAQTSDVVYEPGGDVKPPKLVHYVEPAFSPSSKEAFVEGTVKISTVVTREGTATNLRVTSGLNAEEDRTAIEAVKQWKFQPGTKAGQPVNVRVNVEVTFHLL